MSSIIQNKQDQERKAALAEDRKRRERRRQKELASVNGTMPEDEEGHHHSLPIRSQSSKSNRSLSPTVGRSSENGIAAAMNGAHSGGHNSTRDSFLNYFFGKDGMQSVTPLPQAPSHQGRQASQSMESSVGHHNAHRTELRSPMLPPAEEFAAPPDFGSDALQFPHDNSEPALTDRELLETELIRRLISSYFNIVRETIADQVPKAIMHLLVNHSKDVVQNRL
ncbi:Dynamin-related GTPase protein, partial [Elasticomyces elasticus]